MVLVALGGLRSVAIRFALVAFAPRSSGMGDK